MDGLGFGVQQGSMVATGTIDPGSDTLHSGSSGVSGLTTVTPATEWTLTLSEIARVPSDARQVLASVQLQDAAIPAIFARADCVRVPQDPSVVRIQVVDAAGAPVAAPAGTRIAFSVWRSCVAQ